MRREVVRIIDVPYDRDRDGKEVTVPMLELSCSHRYPASRVHAKVWTEGQDDAPAGRQGQTRWCKKCEQEGRTE